MKQHTEECRAGCTLNGDANTELLHEVVERLDRLTSVLETGAAILGPILRKRLVKLGAAHAVGKVEAEWGAGERD